MNNNNNNSSKNHTSAILLLLLQLGLIAAFQPNAVFSLSSLQTSSHHRPRIIYKRVSAFASTAVDDDETSHYVAEYGETEVSYDWDEQFEELQSFKREYGHCHFPTNPSREMSERYPELAKFCKDQRQEYRRDKYDAKRRSNRKARNLSTFDRRVRLLALEEIGFEFSTVIAQWYEKYCELKEYREKNGHVRVTERENPQLLHWTRNQRQRLRGIGFYKKLSDAEVRLLDDIGFEWESEFYDALWMEHYNELVAFRNKHGHLGVNSGSPLYHWMANQRLRRDSLSEEQIRLLDEIELPWEPDRHDAKWSANYNELVTFQQTHGHCKPRSSQNSKLCNWSLIQRKKREVGLLSIEQIELLDRIGFSWNGTAKPWAKMFKELLEFSHENDNLQVNQADYPELYEWMALQRNRYHGIVEKKRDLISASQIDELEEIHFCWSLDRNDRIWHEKYTEAVEFYKENGHIGVVEKDNPSLYNWIASQGKRYEGIKGQKPLSEDELELLEQIDFDFFDNQPRMTWNTMYDELKKYRDENEGIFPEHKDDPKLNRWMRHQQKRLRGSYGYVPLSDEQQSLLESIDCPMLPMGNRNLRNWYERYDELVDFWKEQGHFLVDHSENPRLGKWMEKQRLKYNGSVSALLSEGGRLWRPEIYLLERIGFPWTSDRSELEWQWKYNELVQFFEKHGHLGVKRRENSSLSEWISSQRKRYKGKGSSDLSDDQIRQLEEIGFRWSLKE